MDSHHDGHRDLRIFFTIGDGSCEGDDAYGSTHSKISDASDTFTSAGSADATSAGHRAAWGTAAASRPRLIASQTILSVTVILD